MAQQGPLGSRLRRRVAEGHVTLLRCPPTLAAAGRFASLAEKPEAAAAAAGSDGSSRGSSLSSLNAQVSLGVSKSNVSLSCQLGKVTRHNLGRPGFGEPTRRRKGQM